MIEDTAQHIRSAKAAQERAESIGVRAKISRTKPRREDIAWLINTVLGLAEAHKDAMATIDTLRTRKADNDEESPDAGEPTGA